MKNDTLTTVEVTAEDNTITQKQLNSGPTLIAKSGKLCVYAEQSGTKGVYEVSFENDLRATGIKYVRGIKQVRGIAKRLNWVFSNKSKTE